MCWRMKTKTKERGKPKLTWNLHERTTDVTPVNYICLDHKSKGNIRLIRLKQLSLF